MRYQADRLVRLGEAGFEGRERLRIVSPEDQNMREDHPVVLRHGGGTQALERLASGLAELPILAPPSLEEQPASGGEKLRAVVQQWIADPGAQRHGLVNRGEAAVRIEEYEGTDEGAECLDSRGNEVGPGRAVSRRLVRAC